MFASAEVAGLASTGGLGEVAAALPDVLAKRGHAVCSVMPLYRAVRERLDLERYGNGRWCEGPPTRHGVRRLFLEDRHFFDREGLYGDAAGEFDDSLERFAYFSRALVEDLPALGLRPDVVHTNDWHTGLVGAWRSLAGDDHPARGAALVLTIHNLAYQGRFSGERFAVLGLPPRLFSPEVLEFWGDLNCLKAGLVFADAVTTVSRRYAEEILTPELGEGLDGVLRHDVRRLVGIRNGIDVERWDPRTDPWIAAPYGPDDLAGKVRCREALLADTGVKPAPGAPLLGMIGRLVPQKGCDLVLEAADDILGSGAALVVLGSGDPGLERGFRDLARRAPGKVATTIGFDDLLAHQIEAGADAVLMPSRFEPCGLTQMASLRYGALPLVRATGGLADTVRDLDEDPGGNGFRFGPVTGSALAGAMQRLAAAHRDPDRWTSAMQRGMREDFSWDRSARDYEDLYRGLLAVRRND